MVVFSVRGDSIRSTQTRDGVGWDFLWGQTAGMRDTYDTGYLSREKLNTRHRTDPVPTCT